MVVWIWVSVLPGLPLLCAFVDEDFLRMRMTQSTGLCPVHDVTVPCIHKPFGCLRLSASGRMQIFLMMQSFSVNAKARPTVMPMFLCEALLFAAGLLLENSCSLGVQLSTQLLK